MTVHGSYNAHLCANSPNEALEVKTHMQTKESGGEGESNASASFLSAAFSHGKQTEHHISVLKHLLHGCTGSVQQVHFRSKPCTPTPTTLSLKPSKEN